MRCPLAAAAADQRFYFHIKPGPTDPRNGGEEGKNVLPWKLCNLRRSNQACCCCSRDVDETRRDVMSALHAIDALAGRPHVLWPQIFTALSVPCHLGATLTVPRWCSMYTNVSPKESANCTCCCCCYNRQNLKAAELAAVKG